MRAVVYNAREDVAITDVPEPKAGDGQVLVKVGYNGICGTDLHEYYAGPSSSRPNPPLTGRAAPLILGHELAGTVVEVGPGVKSLSEGDRIAVEPLTCAESACPAGGPLQHLHPDRLPRPVHRRRNGRVHRPQRVDGAELPDEVSTELGALVEPMSVAFHAAKLGDVDPTAPRWSSVVGRSASACGSPSRAGNRDVLVVEPSPVRHAAIENLGRARSTRPPSTFPRSSPTTAGLGAAAAFDAAGVQPAIEPRLRRWDRRERWSASPSTNGRWNTAAAAWCSVRPDPGNDLLHRSPTDRAVIDLMAGGHYDAAGWLEKIALGDIVTELRGPESRFEMKVLVDPDA